MSTVGITGSDMFQIISYVKKPEIETFKATFSVITQLCKFLILLNL